MKTPLRYQISEYDCGPTAFLNAVSFLFEREQIPPELIRNVMLYSLDSYGTDGVSGKNGTSRTAMMFLSHWLDGFGGVGRLPVSSRYLSGSAVRFGAAGELTDALRRGGAAVVRLMLDVEHYVTLTGIEGDDLLMFDPYFYEGPFDDPGIRTVTDRPYSYNRIVPVSLLEREDSALYALGRRDDREAVLIFNEDTKLTPEKSIEYFI
ncbi:MAG: peptidase C39 [Ruminococcaceae bacterium]|nr:peptidase C39 [Oscillospiraceae bacterium]